MDDLFSVRTKQLVHFNKDKPSQTLRVSIDGIFENIYADIPDKQLEMQRNIMSFFGIEQEIAPTTRINLLSSNAYKIRDFLQKCKWYQVYDFIEFIIEHFSDEPFMKRDLESKINDIFRYQGYKYRVVAGKIVPIVNTEEIAEINRAMTTGIESVDAAYFDAVKLLSIKHQPDYNAVVSKASNALEAMAITITKQEGCSEDTLGKAFNVLQKNGIIEDERLINVSKTIYKYACNSGLRHGGADNLVATENDAIYILVLCAACINYLDYLYKQTAEKEAP